MEPSASGVRQMQDLRQAEENQAPLRDMCREAQPAKRGVGQETAESKMNANQVNSHIKKFGVKIRRGDGYYYWIDLRGDYAIECAESVYVYSASQLPLDRWIELAKQVATNQQEKNQNDI